MCAEKELFQNLQQMQRPIHIHRGDNSVSSCNLQGDVIINGHRIHCYYTPTFPNSLHSVSQLDELGMTSVFAKGHVQITDSTGKPFLTAINNRGLYKFNLDLPRAYTAAASSSVTVDTVEISQSTPESATAILWHRRFAHANPNAIHKIVPGFKHDNHICDVCVLAKKKRYFRRTPVSRASCPFEVIHTDTCGPFSTPTLSGNQHFIIFIDDYTRFATVYLLKKKNAASVMEAYACFLARIDNFSRTLGHDFTVSKLRCDNDRAAYDTIEFRQFLSKLGTKLEFSPPYHQDKNGVAEHTIGVIVSKAHAMIIDSQVNVAFWGEAVNTAT
jgi:hypothetical protein